MPTYVKLRGLQRGRGTRIRSGLAAQNAVTVGNRTSVVVDLDDAKTRQDVAHHSSIGNIAIVGSAQAQRATGGTPTVVQSGVLAKRAPGSLSTPVSGGTLLLNAGTTQAVTATTVTAGAAPGSGLRIDLIQVHQGTGAVTLKAGTAAVTGAAAPAADALNVGVAEVYVPAGATQPQLVNDVRPLP